MSRARCPRCQRPLDHCLCPLIPELPSHTRVLVLQHPDEARHALNTARLAVLGLQNAELQVGEDFTDLQLQLQRSDAEAWLLFPGEDARQASGLARPAGERWLIVPDGTWRKARLLLYLNPWLQALPRLTLPEGLHSRYRLRKAPGPGALSTIEAISLCLGELEGRDYSALLRPFEALIEGQIAAMGEDTYRRNHQQDQRSRSDS